MICSKSLKNNVIYIVMVSRKQKKHELVDDLLPIINKRLDEERHVARVEMCMILSKELYINSKLLESNNLAKEDFTSTFA